MSREVSEESRLFELWGRTGWRTATGRTERPTVEEVARSARYRFRAKQLDILEIYVFARAWELQAVRKHLLRLDTCLREYFDRGGDRVIGTIYGHNYEAVATLLAITDQYIVYRPGETIFTFDALQRLGLSQALEALRPAIEKYFPEGSLVDRLQSNSIAAPSAVEFPGSKE